VNIDEQQTLAAEYGYGPSAIPTLLLFSKGQVAEQIVGRAQQARFQGQPGSRRGLTAPVPRGGIMPPHHHARQFTQRAELFQTTRPAHVRREFPIVRALEQIKTQSARPFIPRALATPAG